MGLIFFVKKTMKQIMVQCINAVKNKLQCKLGYFDMFGFDFLIDEDMKVRFNYDWIDFIIIPTSYSFMSVFP